MKASEELMLLLELNGFDIQKFKLKKQLEYEKTGNMDLFRHKKFQDILVSHYQFQEEKDYFHRCPLMFRESWGEDVMSIDQFYFKHKELDYEITLKDFSQLEGFNEVQKESILYDVLDEWVEQYRETSITKMERLREMILLLPKKNRKYKKPGKLGMVFMVLLLGLLGFLYKTPEVLKPAFLPFVHPLVSALNAQLYYVNWFSFLGFMAIILSALYVVLNNALTRYIRDVRSEKNKHAEWMFDKWEKDLENARLNQSGQLEDYVDTVIKNPKKTYFDIRKMIGPELLLDKFKRYVQTVEHRYDWMTKYYTTLMRWLRRSFLLALLFNIAFYIIGFALFRGWINV
jgi:ABC-type multidrug transport system fused ATPase/permease subunit